jgi:hypothetical protein
MKPDDIDKLTLGELRQIADRALDALQRFKSVSVVMNADELAPEDDEPAVTPPERGRKSKRPVIDEDAAAAHRRRQFQPVEGDEPRALKGKKPPRTNHPGGDLTAAERAQRNRLIGSTAVDPNLPEDMQRMEAGE